MKNIIKDELKPCPFCGNVSDRYDPDCIYPATRGDYNPKTDKIEYNLWNLCCTYCQCFILGSSPEACIKAWNNRQNIA